MDKNDPREGDSELRHLLVQAERQFWASGDALDAVIADIKDGKFGATKDLTAVVASLRKGLEAVFSERARLEKYETDVGTGTGELDLGAARTEIRRRMDRLRASFSPREVSDGSDG